MRLRLYRHHKILRALLLFAFALACVVFAGHVEPVLGNTDGVTSIFRPLSQPAQEIKETSLLVLAICGAIFVVVAGLLVYAIIRFRHRAGDELSEPPQVYGSNQIELAWTILPLLIVFVLILVTSRTIADIQNRKPPPTAVQATVIGHQWWWEIRYPELGIVTANELHVPASDGRESRPTFLKLQSADVAHSFWVPLLSGKTDLIPNRENLMWIEPTKPGTYLGNCAEYCGTQHSGMIGRVIVMKPEEYADWLASGQPGTTLAQAGEKRFRELGCSGCHMGSSIVRAPPLEGLYGKPVPLLGGAVVTADEGYIRDSILLPASQVTAGYQPVMPTYQGRINEEELLELIAYIKSLGSKQPPPSQ